MSRAPLPRKLKTEVLRRSNRCHLCGGQALVLEGETWVVDHVVPKSQGGADTLGNLAKAHSTCNAWRSAAPITDSLRQEILRRRRVELFIQD